MAAVAGGPQVAALSAYGEDIGLAFQIADDVLDATATSEELGKTAGRDAAAAKSTYVSVLGVDGARREAERRPGARWRTSTRRACRAGLWGPWPGILLAGTPDRHTQRWHPAAKRSGPAGGIVDPSLRSG